MTSLDDIRRHSTGISTFSGTRLFTLEDGVERGQRVLEMRSGGGLEMDVMVDRSGDIGRLSLAGQTLSWHGTGGLPSPWLINAEGDRGQGFLRGFGGFLNTCGLDHIRQPETDRAPFAEQDVLADVDYPLHGRGAFHPAVLRGHGIDDEDGSAPVIFSETEFVQAMPFVSALRLRRRIEMPFGERTIRIKDRVRNVGCGEATHMLLYHFNLGFPLVRPGMQVDLVDDACTWQSTIHDAAAPMGAPESTQEQLLSVFTHEADYGVAKLIDPDGEIAFSLSYQADNLPFCQVLRMQRPGSYGLAIEPCTAAARTRQDARDSRQMIILQPGEERDYELELRFDAAATGGSK